MDEPSEWALREAAQIGLGMHDPEWHDDANSNDCRFCQQVARALDVARRKGKEEMRERAACELDGVVVPASGKIGWGKIANVAAAIRALPLDADT